MLEYIVLGAIQGITEWLPVSSEGIITVAYSELLGAPVSDAIPYALWLHAGTALSAVVSFRSQVVKLMREVVSIPKKPSNILVFLLISTVISGLVGLPLFIMIDNLSESVGLSAMALVGLLMIATGAMQFVKPTLPKQTSDQTPVLDALLAGFAQGLSVLPGLSRSGLTISVLILRKVDKQSALTLSFIMSIPASIAASTYMILSDKIEVGTEHIAAGLVAFIFGLITIQGLVKIASRINFGMFVVPIGILMLAGATWEWIGT